MRTMRISILLFTALVSSAYAGNWPAWRGPDANGVSDEKNPPIKWSPEQNVVWKAEIPGGNSTPIIWGDRVFVTAASDQGHLRSLICLDRASGKKLWNSDVSYQKKEPTHEGNPYCSASPVTDGKTVFVSFGSAGAAAYDFAGKQLWQADLGEVTHIWGNASTPVLFEKTVILSVGPGINCYLTALEQQTGKTVWKTPLPEATAKAPGEFKGSWSTPVLAKLDGKETLVVDLPGYVAGFDPATGKEIWRCTGLGLLAYSNPLFGKDAIVGMSGYGGPALGMRIPKANETGDLTASHRLWLVKQKNPQRIGSGVVIGDRVYTLEEPGTARCFDIHTGAEIWHEARVTNSSWSSTELVDGKLFSTDQKGTTVVWKPGDKFEEIGRNEMQDKMRASLAFSDGQVFVRTYQALYCVGAKPVN